MKNYEKIIDEMTIDEIADFMQNISLKGICSHCIGCDKEEIYSCKKGIRMWLKAEVNDNEST